MLTRAPKCTTNTAWEAKAIAVLYSIKNDEVCCYHGSSLPLGMHTFTGLLVVCILVQWFVKGCTDLLGGVGTYWNSAIEELVQKCLAVDHPR